MIDPVPDDPVVYPSEFRHPPWRRLAFMIVTTIAVSVIAWLVFGRSPGGAIGGAVTGIGLSAWIWREASTPVVDDPPLAPDADPSPER